ncbi:hypothetical protein NKH33_24705 [Mesorhizobium sp. M1182]|uniref:group II intron maturase-specific domain-containing protein n=1 Tax=unclassified Mesorhizobium TaxID=325217 RepID=UPI00333569FA
MREKIRDLHIRRQTQLSLNDIARLINPLLRGWIRGAQAFPLLANSIKLPNDSLRPKQGTRGRR